METDYLIVRDASGGLRVALTTALIISRVIAFKLSLRGIHVELCDRINGSFTEKLFRHGNYLLYVILYVAEVALNRYILTL